MTTCTQIETATISKSVFYDYPDSAFVRESQLVRSPKRPEHTAPLPFSAPTLWRKVADGTFPKPVKFSKRVTCWKVSEVRAWMEAQEPSTPHVLETNSGNTPVAAPNTSLTFEDIASAVARGWCSPDNAHKVLDSDLALAITGEVQALIEGGAA